jgi:hypothetical protein
MSLVGAPLRAVTRETRGPLDANTNRIQGGLTVENGIYLPANVTTLIDHFHDKDHGPTTMFTEDDLRQAVLQYIPEEVWGRRVHNKPQLRPPYKVAIYMGRIPIRFTNQAFRRGSSFSSILVSIDMSNADRIVKLEFENNMGEVCAVFQLDDMKTLLTTSLLCPKFLNFLFDTDCLSIVKRTHGNLCTNNNNESRTCAGSWSWSWSRCACCSSPVPM